MSNKCMNHVWQQSKSKGRARLVLLALADMANDDGECWPGKANLAEKCNMDLRNVLLTINKLQADGEIAIFHRRAGILNRTNRYQIFMGGSDQEIGRGDDQEIATYRSGDRQGDDQEIGRGDDQEIARSLSIDPLFDPLSDPRASTPPQNETAIQRAHRERRERKQ